MTTPPTLADATIRAAHAACVDRLRSGGSLVTPVPASVELRIHLARVGKVVSREDVVRMCRALGLLLADA